MITESEKARRIALGRHAGAFLRALAGESKGAFAHVCREIGGVLLRDAVNLEGADVADLSARIDAHKRRQERMRGHA